jgi:hypothetical protein
MGHDPTNETSLLPYSLDQNPAPTEETGQDFQRKKQALVNDIMRTIMGLLPSNYVAFVNGPWYTLQFQAIAEQFAAIQIAAEEIHKDSNFDFTRSDFLWEVIGTLVFPGATERSGAPIIEGDVDFRAFLHRMVLLLLAGSKASSVQGGVETLTDAQVTLIEKFLHSIQRDPNGLWTIDNQFEMELFIEGFPVGVDPFQLLANLKIVVEALKPAHTLFQFSWLFREVFPPIFDDEDGDGDPNMSWVLDTYYYDDFRKNCYGVKEISGTGATLADRTLFSDPARSFVSVHPGVRSELQITSGANTGRYQVVDVRAFASGDDATPRAYTTSPSALTGTATVSGDVITDSSQDWSDAEEGEILTFTAGPNAGSYRLDTLLGPNGGPLSDPLVTGPATQVRVSPSILRVNRRMPSPSITGQAYTVTVDRLGERTVKTVTDEDVSEQFYL